MSILVPFTTIISINLTMNLYQMTRLHIVTVTGQPMRLDSWNHLFQHIMKSKPTDTIPSKKNTSDLMFTFPSRDPRFRITTHSIFRFGILMWTCQIWMNDAMKTFATKTFAMKINFVVKSGKVQRGVPTYQEIIKNITVVM